MTLTRVPVLTACTLASLAVGELSTKARAIASPTPEIEADHTIETKSVPIVLEDPVAQPETLPSAEFATPVPGSSAATTAASLSPVPLQVSLDATAPEPLVPPVQSTPSTVPSPAPRAAQPTLAAPPIVPSPQPSQRSSLPSTARQPSTLNPQPNSAPSTVNPQPSTLNPTTQNSKFKTQNSHSTTSSQPPTIKNLAAQVTAEFAPKTATTQPAAAANITKPSVQVRKASTTQSAPAKISQKQELDWRTTPKVALAQTVRVATSTLVAPPETLALPPARSRPSAHPAKPPLERTIAQAPVQIPQASTAQPLPSSPPLSRQASDLGGSIELTRSATSAIELTPAPMARSPRQPAPVLLAGIAPPESVTTPERPALAQVPGASVSLIDVQGSWAEDFITYLAERDVVRGFPDQTFQPETSITRVQLAAILQKAFATSVQPVRELTQFADVPVTYWGYNAIQSAYQRGFLEKFADNTFRPDQVVSRIQALTALAQGLNLTPTQIKPEELSNYFQDADQISPSDRSVVAASLENRLVVNHPDVQQLEPNQIASRADVSALVYQALVRLNQAPALPETSAAAQFIVSPTLATAPPEAPPPVSAEKIQEIQTRLQTLQETAIFGDIFRGSPGITIANPSGFGADNQTAFISGTYQSETRGTDEDDGAFGLGVGFGDARRAVGVEVSYTFASFGGSRDFGSGGFNLKVHRRFPQDFAVAVGWNGLINIGDDNDFEDSPYAVITKVFRTQENINQPFSRVAVSAGLGSGQFRSADDIEDDRDTINPFGSIAIRIAQPVSFITEWTGQDLALGFSIVPFTSRNFNLVITPALRDVAGEGDGARFVLGVGTSFSF